MNNGKNIVNISDSPFSKIIAKKNYIKYVIKIAKVKTKSSLNTPISKNIGIELRTWKKFINQKYIKSLTFQRIGNFCNFSISKITKGIKFIDEIKDPKLPLNFNCNAGVRLFVGMINEGRIRHRIVEYTNKDHEILDIIRVNSKKLIGNITLKERIDTRDQTRCLYFPLIFAKHFIKNRIYGNKNSADLKIPNYILNNKQFHKIWWQANISEEASIYAFVTKVKNKYYLSPRIQLNRNNSVKIGLKHKKMRKVYYKQDLDKHCLSSLNSNVPELTKNEVQILKSFGIIVQPYFSKVYVSSLGKITATYTILITRLKDLMTFYSKIGFELKRHENQLKLLLKCRGALSKQSLKDILINFYKFIPRYKRGNLKIKTNKWLSNKDKRLLI